MSSAEIDAVAKVLVSPQRLPNPALVGRPATYIAQQAGISVPADTRVLIAELKGVGRDYPLSIEKLCPVLSFYVVSDWREGCERCKQILRYGGMGHTMSIHSRNDDVILEFGLKKPAYRIVVNTPTTHGSIGLTTGSRSGDDAGMRRVRREHHVGQHFASPPPEHQAAGVRGHAGGRAKPGVARRTRRGPPAAAATCAPPPPAGISADVMARRIDEFLTSRGYRAAAAPAASPPSEAAGRRTGARAGRTEPECRKAFRLRMRRRRPAGNPPGSQNCNRRALNRDTGGARPRRTASALRSGELAMSDCKLLNPHRFCIRASTSRVDRSISAMLC